MTELQKGDSRGARGAERREREGLSVRQKRERERERLADRLTESSREREKKEE